MAGQFWCHSLCILVFIVAVACSQNRLETQRAPSEVIAVVNGRPILEEEFESFVSTGDDGLGEDAVDLPRDLLFREFLMERLLLEEAEKRNITLEEKEVEDHLTQWLVHEERATPDLVERVRRFLMIQKLVRQEIESQVSVNLQDMKTYYREHEEEFAVEDQAHVLEILADSLVGAEEIRSGLEFRDVRSFKKAAQVYSGGLTASEGGDLGTFERGQLPENFEKFIFALKPGEISSVFQSGEGFHIFMVEEWIPRHPRKFHEVQKEIFDRLAVTQERSALQHYANQLRETASIEVRDETLNLKWERLNAGIE